MSKLIKLYARKASLSRQLLLFECCEYDVTHDGYYRQIVFMHTSTLDNLIIWVPWEQPAKGVPLLKSIRNKALKQEDFNCIYGCGEPILTMEQVENSFAIFKLSGMGGLKNYFLSLDIFKKADSK